jgi:O-antigen/teichoic acid export membrane protein
MSELDGYASPVLSGFRWRRLFDQLQLLVVRAGATVAKFLLAIYTVRYLSLADLGIYGLLVGATTIVPAVLGLGMTEWVMRKIVDLPRAQALPMVVSRLGLTLCLHLVIQPLAFLLDILLGEPIPLPIALISGAILMLENLGAQAADMLIARGRVFLAYWITFLRTGFWPIPVMVLGLLYPETRTLEFVLLGWLAMLVVSWIVLFGLLLSKRRWRHARPHWGFLSQNLHGSLRLYVKDVSGTISAFLDRFLISAFLGLELTGVYTLYWSIASVMHSLAVFGVVQAQLPVLIAAGQSGDPKVFRVLERQLQIELGGWALLLALGTAVATPLFLPFLDQPLVQDYLPVFWIVLGATLLRVAADGYGFVLLALGRDRAIAAIAVAGAAASAVLNLILTPLAGLMGAAVAYVIVSGGLFAARYYFSQPRPSQTRPATRAGEAKEAEAETSQGVV